MRMRFHPKKTLTATAAVTLAVAGAAFTAPGVAHAAPAAAPGTQVTGTLANGTVWIAEYPAAWNGTLLLYSHGFGPLTAADAPDANTQAALLARGYALAGSSYDPNNSEWALDTAVSDQFGTLAAVESSVLPHRPAHVLAVGTSMGGLISALEAQNGRGEIDGALTTCGIVGGGVNLNEYQIDGEYAIAQLLGDPATQLVGFGDVPTALGTAGALTADAASAQQTAAGQARLALAMAFLNVTPWEPASATPAPDSDPAAQEAAEYDVLFGGGFNIMDFIELGRISIEQADGGQATWDTGTDFARVLRNSPYKHQVEALYRAAGLNLGADLATLTAHTSTSADPAALRSLYRTSVPTGRLEVPELDLHTIGDNLVPVQNENNYRHLVDRAGSGSLLRQAYTASFGHCNFSPAELVAGVQAVLHRVTAGHWDNVATTASLQQAATSLNLGAARFADYNPGELTGQVWSR
ncbi:hypothetical protein [Trebonia kvetii]|uniref:hypothetical protein n=1 Tax=Trebonia kvetii TaxID=2480626 RepID=UPI001C9E9D37|nr:hypothetical protein [Trebonia kvetii]